MKLVWVLSMPWWIPTRISERILRLLMKFFLRFHDKLLRWLEKQYSKLWIMPYKIFEEIRTESLKKLIYKWSKQQQIIRAMFGPQESYFDEILELFVEECQVEFVQEFLKMLFFSNCWSLSRVEFKEKSL